MLLGICLQQPQKPIRLASRPVPKDTASFRPETSTSVPMIGRLENRLLRDLESAADVPASQSDTRNLRDVWVAQPRGGCNQVGKRSAFSGGGIIGFAGFLLSGKPCVWRGASSGNLYRPSPRQGNDAFQAGFVVGQYNLAAMQARDR